MGCDLPITKSTCVALVTKNHRRQPIFPPTSGFVVKTFATIRVELLFNGLQVSLCDKSSYLFLFTNFRNFRNYGSESYGLITWNELSELSELSELWFRKLWIHNLKPTFGTFVTLVLKVQKWGWTFGSFWTRVSKVDITTFTTFTTHIGESCENWRTLQPTNFRN